MSKRNNITTSKAGGWAGCLAVAPSAAGLPQDPTAEIIVAVAVAIFVLSCALRSLPIWMMEMLSFYEEVGKVRRRRRLSGQANAVEDDDSPPAQGESDTGAGEQSYRARDGHIGSGSS